MKTTLLSMNGRLARRTITYVIFISTLFSLFASGIQLYAEFQRDVSDVHAGLDQIEKTHLSNITSRVWVLDMDELKTTLDSLLSLPAVHHIAIYENENETLLISVGTDADKNMVTKKYPLIHTLNKKQMQIGSLVIKASLDEVYQHIIDRAIVIITSNTLKTFIVSFLLLFVFYRLVTRHLSSISEFSQNHNPLLEHSPLSLDRKTKKPDELDAVVESINAMHLRLNQQVTESKAAEYALRRSQKMDALGKLTGGIAHDYNNMLGVVLGYTELLQGALNAQEQPKLVRYVKEINRAAQRSARLTEKLLAFSRHKTASTEITNINTVLLDEKHMLEKTLTVRIKLIMDLGKNLWRVMLDESDLEDAILNISINAMHAIDGNGQLTIQTSNQHLDSSEAQKLHIDVGDYVLLSITDTGCGMDEQTKEKLFDPFYSTKGDSGTGLGLSQVYGFVERSNGAISVHSEPAQGTQLKIYFPREIENQNQTRVSNKDSGEHGNQHSRDKASILIVDDEPALLDLTCEILSQNGYQVHSAENARQALEILKKESIDLLLSDIIIPEMDGYELAAIVRKKYPGIKIQLASGYSDKPLKNKADESLRKRVLSKPYKSSDLLQRIKEILS